MAKAPKEKAPKSLTLIKQYQAIFKTTEGQAVLNNLIKDCGAFEQTFNNDPLLMAFAEGRRSVILRILKITEHDIEKSLKLVKEQERKLEDYNDDREY